MARSKICPKCQGSMAEGFVIDNGYGRRDVSTWFQGAPRRSIWGNIKLWGSAPLEIATWRCEGCGFLESYAAAPG